MAGGRSHADPHGECAARDDVDGGGDLGENGGRPEPVAGDDQTEAETLGLRRESGKQRPAFEYRPGQVAVDRQKMVEQPGVSDLGDRVGLALDAQDVGVGDLGGAGFQPERDRHGRGLRWREVHGIAF